MKTVPLTPAQIKLLLELVSYEIECKDGPGADLSTLRSVEATLKGAAIEYDAERYETRDELTTWVRANVLKRGEPMPNLLIADLREWVRVLREVVAK